MKAYSLDLRMKIIETYYSEPISQRALAKRFKVALSFITKLLKQWRETETAERAPIPGRPRKIDPHSEAILLQLVEEHNDWTLEEYRQALKDRTEIEVSTTTICRILKNQGLALKKKRCTPPRKKVSEGSIPFMH